MSVPRLYVANEAAKSNAFQTLGVGALGDAISCIVTEERNGEYELEMVYPADGKRFKDLANDMLIMAKASDRGTEQLFRIYKIEKPIDGKVTVYAQHISYLLNKATCLPFTTESSTASVAFDKIKSNLIWKSDAQYFSNFPFTFWTDNSDNGSVTIETPMSVKSVLGGNDGSILDVIGGEYEFDNFTVKLWKNRGSDSNVYLRYGKNITDLTATDDISDVYNGIVPYWKGSLTRATTESDGSVGSESYETIVYLTDKVLWSSEGLSGYAYPMAVPVDMSSDIEVEDDTSDPDNPKYATEDDVRSQLVTLANEYLKNNKGWNPSSNIEVSFAQLWQTEEYKDVAALQRVGLCDTVHVVYAKLGITVTMKVIKTEYNVLLERFDSMELGEAKSSMSSSLVNSTSSLQNEIAAVAENQQSGLKKAFAYATNQITGKLNALCGALDGHVVFNRNAEGGVNEILLMDTDNKATAQNVWRWNLAGFAHSKNGYNGPFNDIAITQDGLIVANYIVTGVLADGAGNFALNMQTGELNMKNAQFCGVVTSSKISASTVDFGRENHVADPDGTGVYIDKSGISVGLGYNNYPIFSVSQSNGSSSPVRTTGIGFRHSDNTDFGYFYAWGTSSSDGDAMSAGHKMEGGRGRGVSFNYDMGISGRFFANGISSSGNLYTTNALEVGGGSDTNINYDNGGTVYIGRVDDHDYACIVANGSGVKIRPVLDMDGCRIINCGGVNDTGNNTIAGSDRRLKQNIEDIPVEESLNAIDALKPVKFQYKSNPDRERFGFIAQDVQTIKGREDMIQHMRGDYTEYLGLSYSDFIADIVNVVKDQERRINELEEKINGIL